MNWSGLFRRAPRKAAAPAKRKIDDAPRIGKLMSAERAATRAGAKAFKRAKARPDHSSYLLRRNIHRLEKGIVMPARKAVFATNFIGETVTLFAKLSRDPAAEPTEIRWAGDVLDRYFGCVDLGNRTIAKAHRAYEKIDRPDVRDGDPQDHAPYAVADLGAYVGPGHNSLPDGDAFAALCRARRSTRWFDPAPVPQDKLDRALSAALQAPSACNRQPFHFHAFTKPETIRKVAALPLGTKGFGDDLPLLFAVVGDLSAFAEPRDRHLVFIDSSLAAMQFMLALTAEGLASVPINWPDIPDNHEALREILGLGPQHLPIMLIGVGYARDTSMICYSGKKSLSEMVRYAD